MFALAARLIGGAIEPLLDQVSAASLRLLRKVGLLAVAGTCLLVTLAALTIAFALWVSSLKGPIIGALAVAGVYFAVAAIAAIVALWPARSPRQDARQANAERAAAAHATEAHDGLNAQVDDFAAPLMGILQRLGLRREQLAVLAGTSVAKQIGPVPLVGLAIVAGFLIGRMGTALFSNDLVAALLASDLFSGLFGRDTDAEGEAPDAEPRDAA